MTTTTIGRPAVRPIGRYGFRDFCRTVRSLLVLAGANPLGVSDGALIDAWLADENAVRFAARFLAATGQTGGGQ